MDNNNALASERAGRYALSRHEGHDIRVFIPAPLPPQPEIAMDGEMWRLLSNADRALARLDAATTYLPNPELFVSMYVVKEALLSSQIEGTQASMLDVLEFQADKTEADNIEDRQEVWNYIEAMNHGLSRLNDIPLCLRLIKEIHEKLLRGVRGQNRDPGNFRRIQNYIGARNGIEYAVFIPPPVTEMMESLGQWEIFLHTDVDMPILNKVGIAHAQFETIHPFIDGNGRAGRLLITFMLCEQKILQKPLLYLSHYFNQTKSEYYARLQSVRDQGDWEGWLKYFLRGVYSVSVEATDTARQIMQLREHDRALIGSNIRGSPAKTMQLLEYLYHRPVLQVQQAAEMLDVSYATANLIMAKLMSLGVVNEMTGHRRNRRFIYRRYIDLF